MTIYIKNKDQADLFVQSEPGRTLLQILTKSDITLESDCGGRGVCGKCAIRTDNQFSLSQLTPAEKKLLSKGEIQAGKRLACQAHQRDQRDLFLSGPCASGKKDLINPKKILKKGFNTYATVKRSVLEHKWPDTNSTKESRDLKACLGLGNQPFSVEALRQLSQLKNESDTVTVIEDEHKVVSILGGSHPRSLGIAVDLGTTTIAAYLCDLRNGRILTASSKANSQKIAGADIISRIDFACKNSSNLKKLQDFVVQDINELIRESANNVSADIEDIDEMCLAGNPTMQSLFLGINPGSLGRSPYLPATIDPLDIRSSEVKLCLRDEINIHILPMPAAFIGGDAVAAALAVGSPKPGDRILIVDLGTNGELLLLTDKRIFATSAATGPAFEGYTISCGVRAIAGAVNKVSWNNTKKMFEFSVLPGNGKKQAIGFCGSGMIDAVAAAVEAGLIQTNGRINGNKNNSSGRILQMLSAPDADVFVDLTLTQNDIRQLQLGKAALRVGIDELLKTADCNRITKIVFTGAFGANFNWRTACSIGMLPQQILHNTVESVDNAAGIGAVRALLNVKYRKRANEIAKKFNCFDLSRAQDFSLKFAMASKLSP